LTKADGDSLPIPPNPKARWFIQRVTFLFVVIPAQFIPKGAGIHSVIASEARQSQNV
jgi:hypothetical protein